MKDKIILLAIGIVLLLPLVNSAAVTSECSDRTPCNLVPGEERTFNFLIQLSPGEESVRVKFEILDDAGGIAQIVGGDTFDIKEDERGKAQIKVKIPTDISSDKVDLVVRVAQYPENSGEQVQFSPSFTLNFPLNIIDKSIVSENIESEGSRGTMWLIVAAVLLIGAFLAIGIAVLKEKK